MTDNGSDLTTGERLRRLTEGDIVEFRYFKLGTDTATGGGAYVVDSIDDTTIQFATVEDKWTIESDGAVTADWPSSVNIRRVEIDNVVRE
jgi:hypothetical protein